MGGTRCRDRRPDTVAAPDDRGTATLVGSLGLSVAVLALGALSIDLWRAVSAWRSLASTADAAAAAGASGIDETTFRTSGGNVLQLDPTTAEQLVHQSIAGQEDRADVESYQTSATSDEIVVTVHGRIDFSLLGAFVDDDALTLSVTATADPRLSS